MQPLWQILVLTIDSRRDLFDRLMSHLQPQVMPGVEIVTSCDDGEISIGAKRQTMLESATADYVCFFDDDDLPAPDYVSRIHSVLTRFDAPDIVGFRSRLFQNGREAGVYILSYDAKDIPCPGLDRKIRRLNRLPNHLCPVRRELALKAGFIDRNHGEDGEYARQLSKLTPRPREQFLDWYGYDYLFRTQRPGEVTNAMLTGVH